MEGIFEITRASREFKRGDETVSLEADIGPARSRVVVLSAGGKIATEFLSKNGGVEYARKVWRQCQANLLRKGYAPAGEATTETQKVSLPF